MPPPRNSSPQSPSAQPRLTLEAVQLSADASGALRDAGESLLHRRCRAAQLRQHRRLRPLKQASEGLYKGWA